MKSTLTLLPLLWILLIFVWLVGVIWGEIVLGYPIIKIEELTALLSALTIFVTALSQLKQRIKKKT